MTDHEVDPELRPHERVVAGWRDEGYTTDLVVLEGGRVGIRDGERTWEPEELVVERLHRYEGVTHPGDEELLLAVADRDGGLRGTLTLAYGAYATADEAEVARRLPDARR